VPARAALPRELADFLIEFSIALHKHAMYPDGHPTLVPAADTVARRLESLLAERGTLSLGVARDQLVIEGVATDPKNPVLRDLADRLHRHHLGAVSFARGVTGDELADALKLVASDADRQGEPLGLGPQSRLAAWPHVRLYPLTFERLELVEEGTAAEGETGGGRSAQLWVGLARAALAAGDVRDKAPAEPHAFRLGADAASSAEGSKEPKAVGATPPADPAAEPAMVAKAIESHQRGTAYDQVIVGYLLQIADELRTAEGAGTVALKKRMSRLIGALEPRTLERLLDMGGDLGQRRQFILDASQGMAVDAVVDLVKAASGTGAPVSQAMLRMLAKLGHHAERGPAPRRAIAETALRDQVAELVKGWELADPNPGAYAAALQRMSQAAPTLVVASEAQHVAEPVRLLQMACETGAVGDPVSRALEELESQGLLGVVLDLLERAPGPSAATELIRSGVVNPATLKQLLAAQPVDFALVDRLLVSLGRDAIQPMLEVLADSESRQVRRALISRLLKLGDEIGPLLIPWLGDERWNVVRNMLYLAAELPHPPLALNAAGLRQHPDPRVRREALRVLFGQPHERTRAVCTALADEDPRVKRLALGAAGEGGCPEPAVPLVIAIASDGSQHSELRVSAIRALAAHRGRLALDALLRLTEVRRRSLLDAMKAASATPEFLAALGALAAFRSDARARERLEAAARAKDPAVAKVAAEALRGAP
jgi:HEAT repeat protein